MLSAFVMWVFRGWSQANITGANLSWPGDFRLKIDLGKGTGKGRDIWIFGAVNLATYFAASFVYDPVPLFAGVLD